MKKVFLFVKKHNELLVWLTALIFLYCINTEGEGHFTLCVFRLLGFEHCPGCGIGRSIHEAMHFNWNGSWHFHWFGIPALLIIIVRLFHLLKNLFYGPNAAKPVYEYSGSSA
ncbi:MAG: DUF2752 domain-containing protein [Terrimonas sp.]|nr:DUF2752 domain-containing protein [Terrimonas sp.]